MSTIARFSLAEYDDLIARGAFSGPNERRLELIYGELRDMSPIGPVHEDEVDILNEWSIDNAPRDEVRVRVQNSVGVPELDSAPEPDLAWVRRRRYRRARPKGSDVLLLVEVSDSSLEFDRGPKASLYASARIADYWLVNVRGRCVEVRREPSDDGYAQLRTYRPGEVIHPLAFAGLAFPVSLLFPEDDEEDANADS
jgi:Uma2 family endonuclease